MKNMYTRWKNTFLLAVRPKRGFTRVEIMTAVAILLLVALTVSVTFYFVFFKTRLLRAENQIFNNTNFAMQIVAKDLYETIVTPKTGFLPAHLTQSGRNDKLHFLGEKDSQPDELSGQNGFYRLTFSSLNSLKFENAYKNSPIQVVYYLDERTDAAGGLILRRQTNHLPYPAVFAPKVTDPILIKDIQSICFVYYDGNGNAFYDWDSENPHSGFATPAMVEVTVVGGLADKPFALRTTIKLPCWREPSIFTELP